MHRTKWIAAASLAVMTICAAAPAQARDRWTKQQANAWYANQPWRVGSNYVPSDAINQLEMWQEPTFDPARIDQEFGWAQAMGMTTMIMNKEARMILF